MELQRRRFTVVIGVVAAVGLVAALLIKLSHNRLTSVDSGVPAVVTEQGAVHLVVNKNSGRCLGIEGGSKRGGAKAVQGSLPQDAQPHERWVLKQVESGYKLINQHSGFVLEIYGGKSEKGAIASQAAERVDAAHQVWSLEPVGDSYLIRAGHNRMVLGIGQGSQKAGAFAIQWDRIDGVKDQVWLLVPAAATE